MVSAEPLWRNVFLGGKPQIHEDKFQCFCEYPAYEIQEHAFNTETFVKENTKTKIEAKSETKQNLKVTNIHFIFIFLQTLRIQQVCTLSLSF